MRYITVFKCILCRKSLKTVHKVYQVPCPECEGPMDLDKISIESSTRKRKPKWSKERGK